MFHKNWVMNDTEITLHRGFFRFQESIGHHTPLRCGGFCLAWIEVFDLKELQKVLRFLRKVKLKYRIHHPFEDWVVHDSGYKGVVIRLRGYFEGCKIVSENRSQEGEIFVKVAYALVFPHCGAGESSPGMTSFLIGLAVLEEFYVGVKIFVCEAGNIHSKYIREKRYTTNTSTKKHKCVICPRLKLSHTLSYIILPVEKNSIVQPLRNGELFLKNKETIFNKDDVVNFLKYRICMVRVCEDGRLNPMVD